MDIKYTCSSELIDNYKEMEYISSEKQIQGMCNESGYKLFSLGDNGDFNIFYDMDGNETGWEKVVLSNGIKELTGKKDISIKQFCAEKIGNNYFFLVIVHFDNKDKLYYSESDDPSRPEWIELPYDYDNNIPSVISNIFTFVYSDKLRIVADTENAKKTIDRFFIDLNNEIGTGKKWIYHPLPIDYTKTELSQIGIKAKERIPGIYTLGNLNSIVQVIYTPLYNYYDPNQVPLPTRIYIPDAVDVMTVQTTADQYTNLFLCGNGALYICKNDNQKDGAVSEKILESKYFYNVKNLYAYRVPDLKIVMVWGYNQNGDVFYCHCNENQLDDSKSWSPVYKQFGNAVYFYPYYNELTKESSYISYKDDNNLIIGVQSPKTTLWRSSNIALPSSNNAVKFTSYTTKITVSDKDGKILADKDLMLKSKDFCNVYINGRYYSFGEEPVRVHTDSSGVIKIVYQTDSIYSNDFSIYESENEITEINGCEKNIDKILSLNSVDSIKNAKIKKENGSCESLVGNDVSDNDIKAVAESMKYMAESKDNLMNPGNLKSKKRTGVHGITVCVEKGNIKTYSGEESIIKASQMNMIRDFKIGPDGTLTMDNLTFVSNLTGGFISDFWNDLVNAVKEVGETIWEYTIQIVDDIYHFVVKIGEAVYSFVIDCVEALVSGLQIIWSAIKVAVDKLIEFVKFIFDWDDIKKTADVFSKLINLQFDYLNIIIDKAEYDIDKITQTITNSIDDWAKLDHIEGYDSKSMNSINTSEPDFELTSVEGSYLIDHFSDNIDRASLDKQMYLSENSLNIDESPFEEFFEKELEMLKGVYNRIKEEFKDEDITSMNILDISKKILASVADAVILSIKEGLELLLNISKECIDAFKNLLNTKIRIPVLSNILEDWFGIKPFSLLDILSLISSVLVTVSYKLVTQKPLFTEEQYNEIMSYDNMTALNNGVNRLLGIPLPAFIEKNKHTICIIGHMIGFSFRLIEMVIYPIYAYSSSKIISGTDVVLTVLYCAGDFIADLVYRPYSRYDELNYVACLFKYIPLAVIIGSILKHKPSVEKCASAVYVVGCIIDFVCSIGYICLTVESKEGDELTTGITELVQKLCDDIKSCLEKFIKFDEEPESKLIMIVIREVIGGSATALDATEGIMLYNYDLPKE